MESIKNKMESLVKEKEESTAIAEGLENDVVQLNETSTNAEKKSTENERMISNLEGELDMTITETATAHEKLELASKTASDAELEVSALVRKIQLLEEETNRINERLNEVLDKLPTVEKNLEDNERTRKVLEAKSFQNEEKSELQEVQLTEATIIAEEADRKCEEVTRKLRMVENDLERVVDRAEEFERKANEADGQLTNNNKKLKELEELASSNGQKEDEFEEELRRLTFDLNNVEQRAEFAERTVDKLEGTIDLLTDQLYQEKMNYRDLSVKLDTTLNDMMGL
jgi:chromosome segregation ATPase